jgi:hypothetical protein
MVVYNTLNYWDFGLCPLSSIIKTAREHSVSETTRRYVSILRWVGRYHLCCVHLFLLHPTEKMSALLT